MGRRLSGLLEFLTCLSCCRLPPEGAEQNAEIGLEENSEEPTEERIVKFKILRDDVAEKIENSGKKWIGRNGFRNLEEVKTEIGEMLEFIRMNSLITVFWNEDSQTPRISRKLWKNCRDFDSRQFWRSLIFAL